MSAPQQAKPAGKLISMASALVDRVALAARAGLTYLGKRNLSEAFGYLDKIEAADYLLRYERNELAERIIETYPDATWRGNGRVFEDPDPDTETVFEAQWKTLEDRLQVWARFHRADVLAGLGRYSVLLIGAVGDPKTELPRMNKPEDVLYLVAYPEANAKIQEYETNKQDARFGKPKSYSLTGTDDLGTSLGTVDVHWSRVIHIADGLLSNDIFGKPRLRSIWNRLDDLEKLVGGGSEAFFQRAHQGMNVDLDKDIELTPEEETKLNDEVDEYMHNLRRVMRTRGADIKMLGSDTAAFDKCVESILLLIAAGSKIPKRILTGSEQGELASSQDRQNFDERVDDRRTTFAGPICVRPFVDRLIKAGALAEPEEYDIAWPENESSDESEKSKIGKALAEMNRAQGKTIITENEIRETVFGLDPLDEDDIEDRMEDDEEDDVDPDDEEDDPDDDDDVEALVDRRSRARRSVGRSLKTRNGRQWKAVQKSADRNVSSVSKAVTRALKKAGTSLDLSALEAAITSADQTKIESVINDAIVAAGEELDRVLPRVLLKALKDGATSAAKAGRV